MTYMCELNLWGIETEFSFLSFRFHSVCELNLWGIETTPHPWKNANKRAVWIEPVRDWNWLMILPFLIW